MEKNTNDIMRERLKKIVDQRNKNTDFSKKRGSLDRLKKIISKVCNTISIGSLAKFESFFGKEWGHGLEDKDCSKEQIDTYEVWQQCRDEILNLSGKQLRKLLRDIESYFEVDYKGNSVTMIPKHYEAEDFKMEKK